MSNCDKIQPVAGSFNVANCGGQNVSNPGQPAALLISGISTGTPGTNAGISAPNGVTLESDIVTPSHWLLAKKTTSPAASGTFSAEILGASTYAEPGLYVWFHNVGHCEVLSVNGDAVTLRNITIPSGVELLPALPVYFYAPPSDPANFDLVEQWFQNQPIEYDPTKIPTVFPAIAMLTEDGLFFLRPREDRILVGTENDRWELRELRESYQVSHELLEEDRSGQTGSLQYDGFLDLDGLIPAGAHTVEITGVVSGYKATLRIGGREIWNNDNASINDYESVPFRASFEIPLTKKLTWEVTTTATTYPVRYSFHTEGFHVRPY